MNSSCGGSAVAAAVPDNLTPEALGRLAVLRCQGQPWDAVALAADKPYKPTAGDLLRDRLKDDPEWKRQVAAARREIYSDGLAEAVTGLRSWVRSKDPAPACRVANHLARSTRTSIRRRRKAGPNTSADPVDLFNIDEVPDEEFTDILARATRKYLGWGPPPDPPDDSASPDDPEGGLPVGPPPGGPDGIPPVLSDGPAGPAARRRPGPRGPAGLPDRSPPRPRGTAAGPRQVDPGVRPRALGAGAEPGPAGEGGVRDGGDRPGPEPVSAGTGRGEPAGAAGVFA